MLCCGVVHELPQKTGYLFGPSVFDVTRKSNQLLNFSTRKKVKLLFTYQQRLHDGGAGNFFPKQESVSPVVGHFTPPWKYVGTHVGWEVCRVPSGYFSFGPTYIFLQKAKEASVTRRPEQQSHNHTPARTLFHQSDDTRWRGEDIGLRESLCKACGRLTKSNEKRFAKRFARSSQVANSVCNKNAACVPTISPREKSYFSNPSYPN